MLLDPGLVSGGGGGRVGGVGEGMRVSKAKETLLLMQESIMPRCFCSPSLLQSGKCSLMLQLRIVCSAVLVGSGPIRRGEVIRI